MKLHLVRHTNYTTGARMTPSAAVQRTGCPLCDTGTMLTKEKFTMRPRDANADPSQSLIANRPKSRLPEGYTPNSTLPPGYMPPMSNLQKTGEIARQSERTSLSRRQIFVLATGGVALVVLVAIAATFFISALFVQGSLSGPDTSIDSFYSALKQQDYTRAYGQLSPAQKNAQSVGFFTSHYQQLDSLNGAVSDFTIEQSNTNGDHATATVQVTRSTVQNQVVTVTYTLDTLTLVQNNGAWAIDTITSKALTLTPTPIS
jgi:hypothetical protein